MEERVLENPAMGRRALWFRKTFAGSSKATD